jgi:hypothetical protein
MMTPLPTARGSPLAVAEPHEEPIRKLRIQVAPLSRAAVLAASKPPGRSVQVFRPVRHPLWMAVLQNSQFADKL